MIGQTISHYKILEKLGEGGMGVVYKAEDTRLKRTVALKFLAQGLLSEPEENKRFFQEAEAAAALDHPNICTIYEIDQAEGQTFIAMAFLEGQSLKQKIEARPLKLGEAVEIAIQVAEGLKEAHQKGIVHRDIKSSNVIVTRNGQAKILDFGLAKKKGSSLPTKPGMLLGTVAYMSPEQARGEAVDHRTDIWSVGVVLYEMISGQLPFPGDYEQAVIYSLVNENPEPLTGLRSGVPLEWERIVNKALAKSPSQRYQDLADMLVDLRAIRNQLPLLSTERLAGRSKALQKKQSFLYAGLMILIISIIVAGVWLWQDRESRRIEKGSTSQEKSSPPEVALDKYRIAVLPLANISPDAKDEYLADGMTEELISTLSKIAGLRVISRTSVMQFKGVQKSIGQIGQELKVGTVLEGSVRKAADQLRITVQLIDVSTQEYLWSEDYDRKLEDVFAVQSDIAKRISGALRLQLLSGEKERITKKPTQNLEAYTLYLKGRYYWNQRSAEGLKIGMEYFGQAIAEDSTYALAYAGLADSYHILASYSHLPPKQAFLKAKQAAGKALEIDSSLAEAHTSLAAVRLLYDWDWEAAEKEFHQALALNQNYTVAHLWYAAYLTVRERLEEALTEMQKAQALDPLSATVATGMGRQYYLARKYDQAIGHYLRALQLDSGYVFARVFLGLAYLQKGWYQKAIEELKQGLEMSGGTDPGIKAALGNAYALSGSSEQALEVLEDLKEWSKQSYVSPFYIAIVQAGLGNKKEAFRWLEKAYQERSEWLVYLKTEPMLDGLRSDERFVSLLKKVGLG